MSHCKRVLGVIGRVWALAAVFGVLAFGFLDWPSWVAFEPFGWWSAARFVVIAATYIGGLVAAVNFADQCR